MAREVIPIVPLPADRLEEAAAVMARAFFDEPLEFEALGENFPNRARRSEEQIAVLRALWTQEAVDLGGGHLPRPVAHH